MTIVNISHKPNPGELVHLFRLDTSIVGGPVLSFCQGAIGGEPVMFGEVSYTPFDIKMSEFEVNAGGSLPTPKIQIANSNGVIQEIINTYGDLVGAELRRVRTFKRFLDGQPDEDPSAYIGPDVFRIERKSDEGDDFAEWELSAAIDQEGRELPGRQILRDACVKRYRIYDPTHTDAAPDGFVYSTVNPCPYAGTALFDINDQPTENKAQDRCSRALFGCENRFGKANPLPFGGFPGAARVRA